jgi:alpha-tubulin suppressor-like RCC1 family protein
MKIFLICIICITIFSVVGAMNGTVPSYYTWPENSDCIVRTIGGTATTGLRDLYQATFPFHILPSHNITNVWGGYNSFLLLNDENKYIYSGMNTSYMFQPTMLTTNVTQFSNGVLHIMMLLGNGSIYCLDDVNQYGQCTNVPTYDTNVIDVAAYEAVSLYLYANGTLGYRGLAGQGPGVVYTSVQNISIGIYTACACLTNGTIRCFGACGDGQCAIPQLTDYKKICILDVATLIVLNNGTIVCYGNAATCAVYTAFTDVVDCNTFYAINFVTFSNGTLRVVCRSGVTCGASSYSVVPKKIVLSRKSAGLLFDNGTFLMIATTLASTYTEYLLPYDYSGQFLYLDAGDGYTFGVEYDNTLWGWGKQEAAKNQVLGVPVVTDVAYLSCAGDHSIGITANGTAFAWGYNNYGQSTVPAGLQPIINVVACPTFDVLVLQNGSLVIIGKYSTGASIVVPAEVQNVIMADCGSDFIVVLFENHTIYIWGNPTIYLANNSIFVNISSYQQVRKIVASKYHMCGLREDNTVFCRGTDELAPGINTYMQPPIGLGPVFDIAANLLSTLMVVILENHTMITFGEPSANYFLTNFGYDASAINWNNIYQVSMGNTHIMALECGEYIHEFDIFTPINNQTFTNAESVLISSNVTTDFQYQAITMSCWLDDRPVAVNETCIGTQCNYDIGAQRTGEHRLICNATIV